MTERFDAESEGTVYGMSGSGPAYVPGTLTSYGVGLGSGQSATFQENNSSLMFEYPIRWDDMVDDMRRLGEEKNVNQVVDNLTIRDRQLEDFLATNVVNGIVPGDNVSISKSTGVVTVSAGSPDWTNFTPTIVDSTSLAATITFNYSRYTKFGKTIIVCIDCTATFTGVNTVPDQITNLPYNHNTASAGGAYVGFGMMEQHFALARVEGVSDSIAKFYYPNGNVAKQVWYPSMTLTYETP